MGTRRIKEAEKAKRMIAGVRLNGREYRQGDVVKLLPRVVPRGNQDGPGGREGSSTSYQIGSIHMFYSVVLDNDEVCTFVHVTTHPQIDRFRSLYVLEKFDQTAFRVGLGDDEVEVSPEGQFVHVDSITSKVLVVPHFDEDKWETSVCAITMWEAR